VSLPRSSTLITFRVGFPVLKDYVEVTPKNLHKLDVIEVPKLKVGARLELLAGQGYRPEGVVIISGPIYFIKGGDEVVIVSMADQWFEVVCIRTGKTFEVPTERWPCALKCVAEADWKLGDEVLKKTRFLDHWTQGVVTSVSPLEIDGEKWNYVMKAKLQTFQIGDTVSKQGKPRHKGAVVHKHPNGHLQVKWAGGGKIESHLHPDMDVTLC